jgi:hypothetical protein
MWSNWLAFCKLVDSTHLLAKDKQILRRQRRSLQPSVRPAATAAIDRQRKLEKT